jgi:hypothetical protein
MIGFFFKLNRTAHIPWIDRSRAEGSHELGLAPYKGPVDEKGEGIPSADVEDEALGI